MDDDKDGGQAFPRAISADAKNSLNHGMPGMTLRDYFAGQALIGILGSRQGFLIDVGTEDAPEWAYQVADAMLAARKAVRE